MATYPPPRAAADARNRAWRTFVQGLLVDLLIAVTALLSAAAVSPEFAWSREYWTVVGLAVAKTALTTVMSYVARRVVPPGTG